MVVFLSSEDKIKSQRKTERKKELLEFAGSLKNSFESMDWLEYQNKMKEERTFV